METQRIIYTRGGVVALTFTSLPYDDLTSAATRVTKEVQVLQQYCCCCVLYTREYFLSMYGGATAALIIYS